jgi:hypothetical protein
MMPGKKTGLCSGKQKTNNVEACLTDKPRHISFLVNVDF